MAEAVYPATERLGIARTGSLGRPFGIPCAPSLSVWVDGRLLVDSRRAFSPRRSARGDTLLVTA